VEKLQPLREREDPMFTRVVWSQRAAPTPRAEIDKGLSYFRERIIPSLKTQAGFLGAAVLVDSENGEGATVTYWESAEAMAASEAMGAAGRVEAAQATGIIIKDVDRFETLLQDRVGPATAGSFVRVNDVPASTAQIDAAVAWARDTALPKVKSQTGYRALLVSANRATGRMLVASIWESAADRKASESAISGLRSQLAEVAQTKADTRVSLYESMLAEISPAAQQTTTAKAGAA
jgi:heme-degrading monooxygenase HmoA